MIKNANIGNVKAIYDLLNYFAEKDLLLGRSLSSLYDQLRDFKLFWIENKDEPGKENSKYLAGVCALHICWENLAEIRSLAIAVDYQKQGIGSSLVAKCLAEAKLFGISQVFTLTYQPEFFSKFGFEAIDKKELPHKVWKDCVQCHKFPDCNEEAMIWKG
jgi:amino-acid N-acetyltransferase